MRMPLAAMGHANLPVALLSYRRMSRLGYGIGLDEFARIRHNACARLNDFETRSHQRPASLWAGRWISVDLGRDCDETPENRS
jgi:hypothetical protein